ncbi:MAG: aminodeoxychorismate/anthranilate synthase component II [Sphingobacteriaceae bacterium]|nr:aminodeoxychorismate/anthranilate synthase component II [Sphingobacteriaceae bacterium]
MHKIALIDNYDSFTFNLVHLLEKSGDVEVQVFLNDQVDLNTLGKFSNFVISPGPGIPSQAGIVPEFLRQFAKQKNILGVCLGHQAIGEYLHLKLRNLEAVFHGIATPIQHHSNHILFHNIPKQFIGGRYHSWVLDKNSITEDVIITAQDLAGEIMAIKHKTLNLHGVQFHPESILSEHGELLMKNWISTFT